MKHPFSSVFGLAVLACVLLVISASAAVSIDFVTVGNAGKPADTSGYGAVAYEYKIAKNETTIGQYVEFLNAVARTDAYGLYNPLIGTNRNSSGITRSGAPGSYTYNAVTGTANRPITYVSWFDAARFCNWMHNGQPAGLQTALTTESGAYSLLGAMSGVGFTPQAQVTRRKR
jgi:hypothetical protein